MAVLLQLEETQQSEFGFPADDENCLINKAGGADTRATSLFDINPLRSNSHQLTV